MRRPRPLAVVALLGLPVLAAASQPSDLDGAWLGRLGCEDGAYRLTLHVVETAAVKRRSLTYSVRSLGGPERHAGGAGSLAPDGELTLKRPIDIPILPETLQARFEFIAGKPELTLRTEFGAAEAAAGAQVRCRLGDSGKIRFLDCAVKWRLLEDGGECRARLLKSPAKDVGPLPCPKGLAGMRKDGQLVCGRPSLEDDRP